MRKMIIGALLLGMALASQAQTNIYEANGNVGIGVALPVSKLHISDPAESKPGGIDAASKAALKLSRAGTPNYSYPESAEFRLGHGGPSYWGSRLDLYINGAGNITNIPDQHAMTWQYNGNVGVGTVNPRALLDVGRYISNGSLGTVLARLSEGDVQNSGTLLGVRAWETKLPASGGNFGGKSFSIEHSFYGDLNSSINFYRGEGTIGGFMTFTTHSGIERMRISPDGHIGIGTTAPGEKLTVNGKIHAKEIKVNNNIWPDYVFHPSYQLMPLKKIQDFIKINGHLPEVPSAKEVEAKGIEVGANQALLLKKIEELTLHLIAMEQKLEAQSAEINSLKRKK